MNLKRIFWPWGYIRDLEVELDEADDMIDELSERVIDLNEEANSLMNIVLNASRDFGIGVATMAETLETIDGITTPNGTLRKIRRITQEGFDLMVATIDADLVGRVSVIREQAAELKAAAEAAAANDDSEAEEPAGGNPRGEGGTEEAAA